VAINGKSMIEKISNSKHNPKSLNTISFFSGILGLDLGLKDVGLNILLTCEFNKTCQKIIELNEPDVGIIGDISKYSSSEIIKYSGQKKKSEIDLIVGGPPCQAFSTAGKRGGFTDQRGNVFLNYLQLIEEIRPEYFVLENVRGLYSTKLYIETSEYGLSGLSEIPGSALFYVTRKMEELGYKVNFNLYNSANFGVPQVRERIIIIGTLANDRVNFLSPTHSETGKFNLPKWVTLEQVLDNIDLEHEFVQFSSKTKKYLEYLKEGENWKNLPDDVIREAMGNSFNLGGGKTGFFRRLSLKRPSPTLVTHPSMPATLLCHPKELRPLSVQEYKRIQQIPDNYKLLGTTIEKYKQIGNAVPVGLGKAIGKTLINHKKRIKVPEFQSFQYSRYKNMSYDTWMRDFENNYMSKKVHQLNIF